MLVSLRLLLLLLSRFSCVQLCATHTQQPTRLPVPGILQARTLSGLPFPSPGDLPDPGIKPRSPAFQADPLPSEPPEKPQAKERKKQFTAKGTEQANEGVKRCYMSLLSRECERLRGAMLPSRLEKSFFYFSNMTFFLLILFIWFLVAGSWLLHAGFLSLQCIGFWHQWLLPSWSTGSRHTCYSSCSSQP